jgi:hypothetical protein
MSEAAPAAPVDQGTTAAAPATATAAAPAAAPAAPAAGNWFDGFNDDLKGYTQNKGWRDPAATVESYRNLEKLVGVPQDQIIKLPGGDAPPEAWNDIWNRLGRPSDPKEYGFQAPEGQDPAFSEWMGKTFHDAGVPKSMAEKIAAAYAEFGQQVGTQQQEARQAQLATEAAGLKTKWGAAHDQNIGIARQAAQGLGLDGATIDALEAGMGFTKVMELFHTLGTRMGEGGFVGGDRGQQSGVLTPEAAQQRIQALRKDTEFLNKYAAGDEKARREFEQLHKWAYPA